MVAAVAGRVRVVLLAVDERIAVAMGIADVVREGAFQVGGESEFVMGPDVGNPRREFGGCVGLKAKVKVLFRKGEILRKVPEEEILSALMEEIEKI